MRIAVWLKSSCGSGRAARWRFQSAVRIAVWLKIDLVEAEVAQFEFQSAVRIAVWLKSSRICNGPSTSGVSIRRADRCLVEADTPPKLKLIQSVFQSAVRIAVWLKPLDAARLGSASSRFNPPCGSLFG